MPDIFVTFILIFLIASQRFVLEKTHRHHCKLAVFAPKENGGGIPKTKTCLLTFIPTLSHISVTIQDQALKCEI